MASPSSSSTALLEWHRRRRAGSGSSQSPGFRGESFDLLRSPSYDLSGGCMPSPLGTPIWDGYLPCASPAGVNRMDLVHVNRRPVHEEYEFQRTIGEGSFGKVHLAVHQRTGVSRAVKEIPKSGTETDEFEWELQALVALDHPHIVKLIEYFDDEENYYLVMELCSGPDVQSYIVETMEASEDGSGFVPENVVSIILRQCLKAVICCHAHGFVHRDLSPKNFMFSGSDRTVKLIDFGLATRFLGFVPAERYVEIVGTSHYMAPEMMLSGESSPSGDIWSLGVLLYVALTGMTLLPKDDDKKKRLLETEAFVQKKLRNCKALQKRQTSPQAMDLLQAMLQHKPEERVSAAEALAHPFTLAYCHEFLGPPLECVVHFDRSVVQKLRRFASWPSLKKVALLTMTHVASMQDHEQELLAARHTFRTMDADGDGEISIEDLRIGLQANGLLEPDDLEEIFSSCDGSGSGTLSFVEFVACVLPTRMIDEQLCHEAFNVLDHDAKGLLSPEDLQKTCRSYDLAQCEKMVSSADPTGRGYFDFDDFHCFLLGTSLADGTRPSDMPPPSSAERRRPRDAGEPAKQAGCSSPSQTAPAGMSPPGKATAQGGPASPPVDFEDALLAMAPPPKRFHASPSSSMAAGAGEQSSTGLPLTVESEDDMRERLGTEMRCPVSA